MSRPRLPVLATVQRVYNHLGENMPAFVAAAGVWGIAAYAVRAALTWVALEVRAIPLFAASMLIVCFSGLAAAAFAVTWHRFILLHENPTKTSMMRADLLFRYLIRAVIVLVAYVMVVVFVAFMTTQIVGPSSSSGAWIAATAAPLGLAIALALLLSRLSLAFPGVAIGERRMTLLTSWKFTANNSWRLLFASALVIVPISIVSAFAHAAVDQLGERTTAGVLLMAAVDVMFLFLTTALAVALASFAYDHFVGPAEDRPPASHFN